MVDLVAAYCLSTQFDQSLQVTLYVVKGPKGLQVKSKDSDQTVRMRSLIRIFAGRTCNFVGNAVSRLKCVFRVYLSQGPVVQSVVSLTSSLRVILLTVLADSIHDILIFFAEKM